jgi:hypothetical protein
MATHHIDIVNGNDANSGADWANAWKSLQSPGITAARIAQGDTIKVAKTAETVSLGDATWTDNAHTASVVFADSAITKVIDGAKTGWVTMGAGSTVTNGQTTAWVTFDGTNTGRALQWVTSATTNGAYKDLGSDQDFSAYRNINFWFRTTSNLYHLSILWQNLPICLSS